MSPVSQFLTCYYEREDKRGHGKNDTLSVTVVTFWICKALQTSARSPHERCCLRKCFAWPFYFTSRIVAWLQNSTVSKEKNGLKIVTCLENREGKKSEK